MFSGGGGGRVPTPSYVHVCMTENPALLFYLSFDLVYFRDVLWDASIFSSSAGVLFTRAKKCLKWINSYKTGQLIYLSSVLLYIPNYFILQCSRLQKLLHGGCSKTAKCRVILGVKLRDKVNK
jgi:hypothetical protein